MSDKTVIVVEDDPLQRSDAVAMLDAAGLAVVDFETADEAMAFLEERNGKVAAVLTDIQLPGNFDGFDLALKISLSWPKITVLMTSGLDRPLSLLIPTTTFLPKPWLALDVLTAMQNAAEHASTAHGELGVSHPGFFALRVPDVTIMGLA